MDLFLVLEGYTRRLKMKDTELKMNLGYILKPTPKQKKTKSKQSNQQYEPKTKRKQNQARFKQRNYHMRNQQIFTKLI